MPPGSPYQLALGARFDELHPVLRRYFSAIPSGYIGVGKGVFTQFGVTKRWLLPLLRGFERRGVLYAGFAKSLRFRVVNRTVRAIDGSALANAVRTIELPTGSWTMTDSVARVGDVIVDRLGSPRTVAVSFDVCVNEGALLLQSRSLGLIIGGLRVRIPRPLAPVVRLREEYDASNDLQQVQLTIDAPLLGRIYEYQGHFRYEIVKEEQHGN